MSKTYYAVCHVNGPISKAIYANTDDGAVEIFESSDTTSWIDEGFVDAEDDLRISHGDTMDEEEFGDELEDMGCEIVKDLNVITNGHTGKNYHVANGWMLWKKQD